MQTTTQYSLLNKSIIAITTVCALSFSGISHADDAMADLALLDAADKWQMNRLLEPTERQRQKEQHGSIMIYDGLRDTMVKKALDENFDRIENMMFTRVVITDISGKAKVDEAGNEVVEDDGCE